jgi:Uma2 family endonuclease
MNAVPQTQPRLYTYGDYRHWPDEERWELIDGEAFNMCPAPSRQHQEVLMELGRQTANFLLGKPCKVYIAPFDVRLPQADEADDDVNTVVQPDLAVICDHSKLDDKGCRGAPDWAVEIISPHTAAKDRTRKLELYQRHGVREYWLVHPLDLLVTRYILQDGRYAPADAEATTGKMPVQCLPGLEIDWAYLAPNNPTAP